LCVLLFALNAMDKLYLGFAQEIYTKTLNGSN
jgi:hypothetical protein